MQSRQDSNAETYGQSNKVERAVSKSSHAYQNSSWDLVDASKSDDKAVAGASAEELPEEMKEMSVQQRKDYVKQKSSERERVQSEIQSLNKQRQEYINSHTPQESQDAMLDAAMIKAIKEQAAGKKFVWK